MPLHINFEEKAMSVKDAISEAKQEIKNEPESYHISYIEGAVEDANMKGIEDAKAFFLEHYLSVNDPWNLIPHVRWYMSNNIEIPVADIATNISKAIISSKITTPDFETGEDTPMDKVLPLAEVALLFKEKSYPDEGIRVEDEALFTQYFSQSLEFCKSADNFMELMQKVEPWYTGDIKYCTIILEKASGLLSGGDLKEVEEAYNQVA